MMYKVIAKRWARGWQLDIVGIGVTQVHCLSQAENMARDYIQRERNVSSVEIELEVSDEKA